MDNTSVEVQSAKFFQPSAGARSEGIVNESRPEDRKGEECGKLDPPGIGADDERRRYGRKHTLKDYEGVVRHRCRIIGIQAVKPADDPPASCRAKVREEPLSPQ
jgi:hypothetical protein